MSKRILTSTETVINIVTRIFGNVAVVILVAMMLLTVADVFMRHAFNRPLLGTAEVTQFMMVTLAFLAMVLVTGLRAHIKVDLLTKYIPPMTRTVSEGVYYLLGIVPFSFISWQNFIRAGEMQQTHQISELLSIPFYPFYLLLAVSCGLVALLLLINLLQCIIRVVNRWT